MPLIVKRRVHIRLPSRIGETAENGVGRRDIHPDIRMHIPGRSIAEITFSHLLQVMRDRVAAYETLALTLEFAQRQGREMIARTKLACTPGDSSACINDRRDNPAVGDCHRNGGRGTAEKQERRAGSEGEQTGVHHAKTPFRERSQERGKC